MPDLSTDLSTTSSLADRLRYADALAGARLLPGPYRRSPADVLLAVELAHALGIAPVTALSSVHVLDGKPSMSAELMRALVLRAGHRLRIVETNADRCVIEAARRESPDERSTFTYAAADAERAGMLPAKPGSAWAKYPAAMLLARCSSTACRAVFPDVLAGVSYTPDELGADVVDDGRVIVAEVIDPDVVDEPTSPRPRGALDAARAAMGTPRRGDERPATDAQLRALGARLGQTGARDPEVRAELVRQALGLDHRLASARELTRSQASALLDIPADRLDELARSAWAALLDVDADDDPHDPEPVDVDGDVVDAFDDDPTPELAEALAADVLAADAALGGVLSPPARDVVVDVLTGEVLDGPPRRPTLRSDVAAVETTGATETGVDTGETA